MQGYVSTFWEQGMEESPWVIFQDARHCVGPNHGWEREGMHTFAHGGQLTIFAPDGTVVWAGTITTRRLGMFGKLRAGGSDWHPEGMAKERWDKFFHYEPPLNATYRPPSQ